MTVATPNAGRNGAGRVLASVAAVAVPLLVLLLAVGASQASAASLRPVGTFNSPIYVTSPPGDKHRLFVVQRGGTIRVMRDGRKLRRPFLRIPGGVSTAGEGGLLSMAFPRRYPQDRRFYVFYTAPGGHDIRIDEFRRAPRNPNRALGSSQRRVLTVEHSAHTNHYGGQLQFGPDGLLYISTGDGGGEGDPGRNAQDRSSLLGKLLRIDPRRTAGRPYRIPASNPFVGTTGRDEIFAYGLRNPYRFSFDRANGALAIGDVGQARLDEVDYRLPTQPAGANFGWNCYEGSERYTGPNSVPGDCIEGSRHVPPVLEHDITGENCSLIGGYVARHPSLGALRGRYVYGDYCTGELRSAVLRTSGAVDDRRVRGAAVGDFSLVSFGEGLGGRLFVVAQTSGKVFQLRG